MKIIFMGTPDFSVPALQGLIDSEHEIIAVYSQPPRPKGRGQQVQKSPVHELAERKGVPVFNPLSFKKDPDAVEQFKKLGADIAVVAAYGLILPLSVLTAPKHGCLNIHASLLPRWRGASPIQHAIWMGDKTSGVTIMQMEEGLDTGPMLSKKELNIEGMTAPQLHDELSTIGGDMVLDILKNIPKGEKQNDANSVYAPMLKKEDGLIDWTKPAAEIDRQVRALNPWPGTYTFLNGKRLKILSGKISPETSDQSAGTILKNGNISCGSGTVYKIEILQPQNAKAMNIVSAVNGKYLNENAILGS